MRTSATTSCRAAPFFVSAFLLLPPGRPVTLSKLEVASARRCRGLDAVLLERSLVREQREVSGGVFFGGPVMRRTGGRLFPLALGLGLACWAAGRADDKKDDAPNVEEGYTSLFNGKDLTGWKYYGTMLDGKMRTPDQRIEVKEGVIVMNEKDEKG